METQARDCADLRREAWDALPGDPARARRGRAQEFHGGHGSARTLPDGRAAVPDHYNFYSLHVSDPEATYTFNRNEEKVGHYTFPIDYRVTIPVRGGATVTMGAYDSNDVEMPNHEHFVVAGVPPAPAPFDGQYFQLDAESVKPAR